MTPHPIARESVSDALAAADVLRQEVNQLIDDDRRSEFGQFMTPAPVAHFMAEMYAMRGDVIRLLDPGAAVGSLSAAFVDEACRRKKRPREIEVTAFEIDPLLASTLDQTLNYCRARCTHAGIRFTSSVHIGDFIESMVTRLTEGLFATEHPRFTHVIMNPPYRKIRTNSSTRRMLTRVGIETTNLYAAFMSLAIKVMEPGAEFLSITPRSFCNGPYFRAFRRDFIKGMQISRLHVFNSRNQAFKDDAVLQENIITYAIRTSEPRSTAVQITSSDGPDSSLTTNRLVPFETVVRPNDKDAFIHLIVDEQNESVADRMQSLEASLTDLNLTVSTGRVVDFRATQFIRDVPEKSTVPLLYPCNMVDGKVVWPREGQKKPQAIIESQESASLLVDNGYYVVVKRFSAKEERRRVVAAVVDPADLNVKRIGIENHLNYFHCNGEGLTSTVAFGLAAFLNSTEVDTYFRQFNGHTQVNASDLRKLHYPTLAQLKLIGRRAVQLTARTQEAIDQLVAKSLSWECKD